MRKPTFAATILFLIVACLFSSAQVQDIRRAAGGGGGGGGGGSAPAGTVVNTNVASGILAVDASKTNGIAATAAHVVSALGYTPASSNTVVSTYVQKSGDTMTGSLTVTALTNSALTASRAVVSGADKSLASSATTSTELGYVSGVTSAIQTQLDGKQPASANLTNWSAIAATSAGIQSTLGQVYQSTNSNLTLLSGYGPGTWQATNANLTLLSGYGPATWQATNSTLTTLAGTTTVGTGQIVLSSVTDNKQPLAATLTALSTNTTTGTGRIVLESAAGSSVPSGTVVNSTVSNGLLAVDSTKTNGTAATAAMITNAWGIFDGSTTKFVAGDGTLQTPAAGTVYASNIVSGGQLGMGTLSADTATVGGLYYVKSASARGISSTVLLTGGTNIAFQTGGAATNHIVGPSDQAFTIKALEPVQAASSVAGNALYLRASDATAGSGNTGSAAGGSVTITAGDSKYLTSGNSDGGSVTISSGRPSNGGSNGNINLTAPNFLYGFPGGGGNINLTASSTTGGSGNAGSINITAGDGPTPYAAGSVTIKAGKNNGYITSGAIALTTQGTDGGTASYGNGGPMTLTLGTPGTYAAASGTAGNGGSFNINAGAGGVQSGNTTGTGGNGSVLNLNGGAGGNATGAGGTHTGGTGSTITLTSGPGGNATGASGTRTGGNSGDIVMNIATNGTGATANGSFGSIKLQAGGTNILTTTPTLVVAAQNLAVRNSTTPMSVTVNNTYTDDSNYERGVLSWSGNALTLGTEQAGTGVARALNFETGGTNRVQLDTTGALVWQAGQGITNHVVGPSDSAFYLRAGPPIQGSASSNGWPTYVMGGAGTAGSVSGAAAGGDLYLIGGAGATKSTDAFGGNVYIMPGRSSGNQSGSFVNIYSGTGTGSGGIRVISGLGDSISILTTNSTSISRTGAIDIGTGNSAYAGNPQSSLKPGNLSITTGGATGALNNGTTQTTGNSGGSLTISTGQGAPVTNTSTNSNGGSGGAISIEGGIGGAVTANSSYSYVAGDGATITLKSGAGGNASGTGGSYTGGKSGSIVLNIATNGTGATANGSLGAINLQATNVTKVSVTDKALLVPVGSIQSGITKVLTSGAATSFLYIPVPATNAVGGTVIWQLLSTDGTDIQSQSGRTIFDAVAATTTVVAGLTSMTNSTVASSGTLTTAITANVATNNVLALQITGTTSLTTTNLQFKWLLESPAVFNVNPL